MVQYPAKALLTKQVERDPKIIQIMELAITLKVIINKFRNLKENMNLVKREIMKKNI